MEQQHKFALLTERIILAALVYAACVAAISVPLLALESLVGGTTWSVMAAAIAVAIVIGGVVWRYNARIVAKFGAAAAILPEKTNTTWMAAIIAIGMVLRLAWALLFPATPASDAAVYLSLARRLLAGGTYEVVGTLAYWPPGYPLFLVPWLAAFPSERVAILLSNLFLYVVATGGAAKLATRLVGSRAGAVAAVLLAIWPNYIAHAGIPEKEQVLVAALPWLLLMIVAAADAPRRAYRPVAAAGVVLGACCLVQPSLQLFPVVAFAYLWMRGWRIGRAAGATVGILVAALLTVSPWTIRNYFVFGEPILISTNGGSNLYRANNPSATGGYTSRGALDLEGLTEVARDSEGKHLAIAWIIGHPKEFTALAVRKNLLFMGDDAVGIYQSTRGMAVRDSPAGYGALKMIANAFWLGVWVLIAAGILNRWGTRQWPNGAESIVPLMFVYLFALHSVFESAGKYHVPLVGVLAVLITIQCLPGTRQQS